MMMKWLVASGWWLEDAKSNESWHAQSFLGVGLGKRLARTLALPTLALPRLALPRLALPRLRDPKPETRNPLPNARGYILFETIVAMTVLSMAVMVINEGMRQAILSRALSEDYTTARFLMEEILSGMELQPRVVEGMGDNGQFTGVHSRFGYEWEITTIEVPVPPLPQGLEPIQRENLERMFRPYIAKFSVTIHWTRAGLEYEVLGETLLPPEKLWRPAEVPVQ